LTDGNARTLVADAELEARGAPVDELDGALGLDGGDGGVDVLGDDVCAVAELPHRARKRGGDAPPR
jgi:hypothetical protein